MAEKVTRAFIVACSAAAAIGCVRGQVLALPEETEARAIIAVVTPIDTEAWTIFGIDPADPDAHVVFEAPADATLFYLPDSLAENMLAPGPIPFVAGGRPIPDGIGSRSARISIDTATEWQVAEQRAAYVRSKVFIASFDGEACVRGDHCVRGLQCKTECAVATPRAPDPPTLPRFTPCPPGWSAIAFEDARFEVCEPPASSAVIEACGAGRYAAQLPAGRTIHYVDPSAEEGGDGSSARPFTSLRSAILIAADGDVIALSSGDHETAVVNRAVDVIGACAGATSISASPGEDGLHVVAGPGAIRGLTVRGGHRGVFVEGPRRVVLEQLVIEGASYAAIVASYAEVAMRNVVVRDSQRGVEATGDSEVNLGHLDISRVVHTAIQLEGSLTRGVLDQLTITEVRGSTTTGDAISLGPGTGATISATSISGVDRAGIVTQNGASVTISDLVVRDVARVDGFGVAVTDGSSASLDRVLFERALRGGVFIGRNGSELIISDIVTRDCPFPGIATAESTANIQVRRAYSLRDNAAFTAPRTTASVEDLTAVGGHQDGAFVPEACLVAGGRSELRRIEIRGSQLPGLFAEGDFTGFTVEDLTVDGGEGVHLYGADPVNPLFSRAKVSRAKITGTSEAIRLRAATIDLDDVVATDEGAAPSSLGLGISSTNTRVNATRVELTGFSLAFEASNTQVSFTDVSIAGNQAALSVEAGTPILPFLSGVTFRDNGVLFVNP